MIRYIHSQGLMVKVPLLINLLVKLMTICDKVHIQNLNPRHGQIPIYYFWWSQETIEYNYLDQFGPQNQKESQ